MSYNGKPNTLSGKFSPNCANCGKPIEDGSAVVDFSGYATLPAYFHLGCHSAVKDLKKKLSEATEDARDFARYYNDELESQK